MTKGMWRGMVIAVCTALSGAALAEEKPVRLRMASLYPSNLSQLGTLGAALPEKLKQASGGMIDVTFHEPGALMPSAEIFAALASGAVEAVWSSPERWIDEDSAFALFTGVPFGLAAGAHLDWVLSSEGRQLQAELYGRFNLIALPCGLTGPAGSGWFRRKIEAVQDFQGLAMRVEGLSAKILAKLGVQRRTIAPGEIYQAFQLGIIDAAAFALPANDLALGFHQVARHYYYPSAVRPAILLELLLTQARWREMTEGQRALAEKVCAEQARTSLEADREIQGRALRDLQLRGGKLQSGSAEILAAQHRAWTEVVMEESARNPNFARIWESYARFQAAR